MADAQRELNIVISAKDKATKVIKGFAGSFKDFAHDATAGAGVIVGSLSLVAKNMIDVGANIQSARTSFETFLGSGEKAGKLLKELSDFAVKTPFDLPQVVDGSKRLLAFGIEAEKLIPTFTTLGDLSSGNKEKLDQLVLAYGQTRAATKLTGAELRQFTEAGVPLLQTLADQLNKNGGALTKVGTAAKKTKVDVGELNDKLAIARKKLEEATGKAKVKESTLMSLRNTIQNYEKKIGDATKANTSFTGAMVKTKVTAGDVKEMIEDGAISFEQVDKALSSLNSEGGKFFENMKSQSKTFGGVMSNIRDEFIRFSLAVLGFTQEGEIRKGSIFYYLQIAAETMLKTLQEVRPVAQKFVDVLLGNGPALTAILGALIGLMTPLVIAFVGLIAPALAFAAAGTAISAALAYVITNFETLQPWIEALAVGLEALVVMISIRLIPTTIAWMTANIAAATATIIAWAPIILTAAAIGLAVAALHETWKQNLFGIQQKTQALVDWYKKYVLGFFENEFVKKMLTAIDIVSFGFISKFKLMIDVVEGLVGGIRSVISASESLANKVKGGLKVPGFQHGGFVPGGITDAVPAILHGGERVIPRTGTDVNPTGGSANININFSGPISMDSEDRVQDLADRIGRILGRQTELAGKGLAI